MKPGPDSNDYERASNLRVVIGYEDFESAVRAMELHQRFIEPADRELVLSIWKFEPFGLAPLLRQAVSDASSADLIIVTIHGECPLPIEAVEWIEKWRHLRGGREGALLFMVHPDFEAGAHAKLARSYLGSVARGSGLKFFSPSTVSEQPIDRELPRFKTNCVADAVEHSTRYDAWGLNE